MPQAYGTIMKVIGELNVASLLQGHHETVGAVLEGDGATPNLSVPGLEVGNILGLGQVRPPALLSVAKEPSPATGNPRPDSAAEPVEQAEARRTDDHWAMVDEVGVEAPSEMLLVADDLDVAEAGEPVSHAETAIPPKNSHEKISTALGSEEAHEILGCASVSDSADSNPKDAAGVPWRAPHFTGTLAMRMGLAPKAPALFSLSNTDAAVTNTFSDTTIARDQRAEMLPESSANAYISEQTSIQESPAFAAESVARVENEPLLHFETLKVKSFPLNRVPIFSAQAAGVMAALVAVFIAGVLAGFAVDSDATRKADAQTRVLDEMATRLKAEEERLVAMEAETQRKADELKRLADEAEAKLKADEQRRVAEDAAAHRKAEEQKRLADESEAKRQAAEAQRHIEANTEAGAEPRPALESSGAAPAPGLAYAWPPDPPKPEAAKSSPTRRNTVGAKKQKPPSQNVEDNWSTNIFD
jgi:hypothetical protein